MKKLFLFSLGALGLLAAPLARAWTYHDEDVLLVFRKPGYDNVLFNLGNVSQFLNKPSGYNAPVSNFDLNLVKSTFGSDLSDDVRVVVLAVSSSFSSNKRAWLSSAEPNTQAYDRTLSQWQSQLYSKINAIGDKPQSYTQTSAVPSYVISPNHISSYDYIASNAHIADNELPKLGGSASFTVEQAIPAALQFWEIRPSSEIPKPAAILLGTFTFGSDGVLTFGVGGVTPPNIVGITQVNGTNVVQFSTTAGGTYRLRGSSDLTTPLSGWPVVSGSVVGNGSIQSLAATNSGSVGFFSVERNP
jgi:hypothetical protein